METKSKIIDLNVLQIQQIKFLGEFPYATGKRAEEGKTFYRATYNGKSLRFDSGELGNEIKELKEKGKLAIITLSEQQHAKTMQVVDEKTGEVSEETVDVVYYDYVNHVTKAERMAGLQYLQMEKSFEDVKSAPITPETMQTLIASL